MWGCYRICVHTRAIVIITFMINVGALPDVCACKSHCYYALMINVLALPYMCAYKSHLYNCIDILLNSNWFSFYNIADYLIIELFPNIRKGRRSLTAHLRKNSCLPADRNLFVSSYFLISNSNRFCS